jgi:hypothetical protein
MGNVVHGGNGGKPRGGRDLEQVRRERRVGRDLLVLGDEDVAAVECDVANTENAQTLPIAPSTILIGTVMAPPLRFMRYFTIPSSASILRSDS